MNIFYTSNKSYKDKKFYFEAKRQPIVNKIIKKSILKKFIYNKTNIYLIDDTKQLLGSYKIRGAVSKVYQLKKAGCKSICLASTGNFGLSISYLSKKNNIKCRVFVSKNTSKNKIEKLKKFGANIDVSANSYDDAKKGKKLFPKKNVKFIDVCGKDIFYGNASLTIEAIKNIKKIDKSFLKKNFSCLSFGKWEFAHQV